MGSCSGMLFIVLGEGPLQLAVLVVEADAESVEFQFAAYLELRSVQFLPDTAVEILHLLQVVRIGKAQHRPRMPNGGKLVAKVGTHALRRAVLVVHLGV